MISFNKKTVFNKKLSLTIQIVFIKNLKQNFHFNKFSSNFYIKLRKNASYLNNFNYKIVMKGYEKKLP